MHEVAPFVGIRQTHREIVARDHAARVVAEGLEEVGGNRRTEQLDQKLAQPREAFGLAHAGTYIGTQRARASSASSAPLGTGSIGPTTVTFRITPCLSIRNMPCSCAVIAW